MAFRGRASRREFLTVAAITWFASAVIGFVLPLLCIFITARHSSGYLALWGVLRLFLLMSSGAILIPLTVRRLHDYNQGAALLMLPLLILAAPFTWGVFHLPFNDGTGWGITMGLIMALPAAFLAWLAICLVPGSVGENDYGPPVNF